MFCLWRTATAVTVHNRYTQTDTFSLRGMAVTGAITITYKRRTLHVRLYLYV
jgi:hypothetical protein